MAILNELGVDHFSDIINDVREMDNVLLIGEAGIPTVYSIPYKEHLLICGTPFYIIAHQKKFRIFDCEIPLLPKNINNSDIACWRTGFILSSSTTENIESVLDYLSNKDHPMFNTILFNLDLFR